MNKRKSLISTIALRTRPLVLSLWLFSTGVASGQVTTFSYWVPYVDTSHFGGSNTLNSLYIVAEFNNTTVQAADAVFALDAQEPMILYRPQIRDGLHITSNKPLWEVRYFLQVADYNLYEDGESDYAVIEESSLGTEYWVPSINSMVAILATEQSTTVTVDTEQYTLDAGQTQRLLSVPIGTRITSNKRISVVVANYAPDHYGSTFTYLLTPYHLLGTKYYSPQQHGYNYNSATDSSRLFLLSTVDGNSVTINSDVYTLNEGEYLEYPAAGECEITSANPVYAVYLSDIYALDPWGGVFRHYMFALPLVSELLGQREINLPPWSSSGHGFPFGQLGLASFEDGNSVRIFTGGILRDTLVLDRGGRAYFHDGEITGWNTLPLLVESDGPLQVTVSQRGWWNGIAECTGAWTQLNGRETPVAVSDSIRAGWNLISIAQRAQDYSTSVLFPQAISRAFTFDPLAGYVPIDTLRNGVGFWLKFPADSVIRINGTFTEAPIVDVQSGWNMIGSVPYPLPIASIVQIPPGIVISDFFLYNGAYSVADTLQPGEGYWVKASGPGSLVLSSGVASEDYGKTR